jgi:hypothetical protein
MDYGWMDQMGWAHKATLVLLQSSVYFFIQSFHFASSLVLSAMYNIVHIRI